MSIAVFGRRVEGSGSPKPLSAQPLNPKRVKGLVEKRWSGGAIDAPRKSLPQVNESVCQASYWHLQESRGVESAQ